MMSLNRHDPEGPLPSRELLDQLIRETTDLLLTQIPVKKRIEGLSPEQIVAALSPEMRERLAKHLKSEGTQSHTR